MTLWFLVFLANFGRKVGLIPSPTYKHMKYYIRFVDQLIGNATSWTGCGQKTKKASLSVSSSADLMLRAHITHFTTMGSLKEKWYANVEPKSPKKKCRLSLQLSLMHVFTRLIPSSSSIKFKATTAMLAQGIRKEMYYFYCYSACKYLSVYLYVYL